MSSSAPDALQGALRAYFGRVDPEPFQAAPDILQGIHAARDANPHRGFTPGQLAESSRWSFAREARELREAESGSGVDTELRAVYSQINGLAPFRQRANMLRHVQRIKKLDRVVNGKCKAHRVKICLRRMSKEGPRRDGERVVEFFEDELGKVTYRGVVRCGDLWCCPVCASAATEEKRKALREGACAWRDDGGQVVLITQTFPHTRADELGPQWEKLSNARAHFARSKVVKDFREAVGWAGRIAAREVTYGINGWHPHAHELGFVGGCVDDEIIDRWDGALARQWQASCVMNDLDEPSFEHGFRMSLTEVDEYIAKWGIDAEITKWHIKRGRHPGSGDLSGEQRLNGYTPFDLLRIHAGELEAPEKLWLDKNVAAALFAEYAHAVAGTAQLHWSRGLKKTLEESGAEFVDGEREPGADDDKTSVGVLTASDFFAVSHGDHLETFRGLVQIHGWDFAQVFLRHWRDECDRAQSRRIKVAFRNRGISYLFKGGGKR